MGTYTLGHSASKIAQRHWQASRKMAVEFFNLRRSRYSCINLEEFEGEAFLAHVDVCHSWKMETPFDSYLSGQFLKRLRARLEKLKRFHLSLNKKGGRISRTTNLNFEPVSRFEYNACDLWEFFDCSLSAQEAEILKLSCKGMLKKDIAKSVRISHDTLTRRFADINEKMLDVHWGLMQKLFESEERKTHRNHAPTIETERIKIDGKWRTVTGERWPVSGKQKAVIGERYADHWRKVKQDAEERERRGIDL